MPMRASTLRSPAKHAFANFAERACLFRFGEFFREIRHHRAGSSSKQHGHVMRLKNLRGFHHQRQVRQTLA